MERPMTFAAATTKRETVTALEKARQLALSLLVSLLLSLSAGIVVIGVLLIATGVAVALGASGQ